MKGVDLHGRVRHAVLIEGMNCREAARSFGVDRRTVDRTLKSSIPPGHRRGRRVERPKPDAPVGIIAAILDVDRTIPGKQEHTSKRVFERLRDEHGHGGGMTVVQDRILAAKQRRREMFVPSSRPPGHAPADPGEAPGVIGGVERKTHLPVMELPHSDACFLKACPAETTEAPCDAHVAAFDFLGGVPVSIPCDNAKMAVGRIPGDGRRRRGRVFPEPVSHHLLEDRFARPGKGNDKGNDRGKVAGKVGTTRRSFMVPRPRFAGFDDRDGTLADRCRRRMGDTSRGHKGSIGERLAADAAEPQPVPAPACDACDNQSARASSLSLVRHVRHRGNDHPVPTRHGHRQVPVRGHVHEVVIACGPGIIARHPRSREREDTILDPLHHLALIEQKADAPDRAAPSVDRELPGTFAILRRLPEGHMGRAGRRELVQLLRLSETVSMIDVEAGIEAALERGTIGFEVAGHLVSCRIDRRPPRPDMTACPHLPRTHASPKPMGCHIGRR